MVLWVAKGGSDEPPEPPLATGLVLDWCMTWNKFDVKILITFQLIKIIRFYFEMVIKVIIFTKNDKMTFNWWQVIYIDYLLQFETYNIVYKKK